MKALRGWIPAVQRQRAACGAVFQVQAWEQQHSSWVPGGRNQLSALRALEVIQWTAVTYSCRTEMFLHRLTIYQFSPGLNWRAGGTGCNSWAQVCCTHITFGPRLLMVSESLLQFHSHVGLTLRKHRWYWKYLIDWFLYTHNETTVAQTKWSQMLRLRFPITTVQRQWESYNYLTSGQSDCQENEGHQQSHCLWSEAERDCL